MVTKLILEYDGTHFAGWARQPGQRTVQGELEAALERILAEPVAVTVAGRTDRGVHAWAQVASYPHEAIDPLRLNAVLADDVAVLASEPAPVGFDARAQARSRTYCYRLLARRTRAVFARGRALWWPSPLDRQALESCGALLGGTHDFTAFTPTETEHSSFERRVIHAGWRAREDDPDLLELWIEADSFLRHMNRILVGTMLEVAGGRRSLEDFAALLQGRPREHAGPTVAAHGLALASVSYPDGQGCH